MKVFRQDIQIAATAYIVAETEEEARALVQKQCTNAEEFLLEESTGGLVRGCAYETLLEEIALDKNLPRITLSPVITLRGPFNSDNIDEVA